MERMYDLSDVDALALLEWRQTIDPSSGYPRWHKLQAIQAQFSQWPCGVPTLDQLCEWIVNDSAAMAEFDEMTLHYSEYGKPDAFSLARMYLRYCGDEYLGH